MLQTPLRGAEAAVAVGERRLSAGLRRASERLAGRLYFAFSESNAGTKTSYLLINAQPVPPPQFLRTGLAFPAEEELRPDSESCWADADLQKLHGAQ